MGNRGDMMENHLTSYQSVITEIKSIISSGQEAVYSASSKAMLLTYWNNYYIKFYQCFPDEQIVNACVHRITHQDVGQIDMYVRMYDDLKRGQGDNPTICLICLRKNS
jgi:hypothetical protein